MGDTGDRVLVDTNVGSEVPRNKVHRVCDAFCDRLDDALGAL